MKIGLIREGKNPPDQRVIFTPKQCKELIKTHTELRLVVESSQNRCFSDKEYQKEGIDIVTDISDCDVLMGIKEVPKDLLIPDKTYFFFSHTIKKQEYNRALLQTILKKNIRLIDYECLTYENGLRILGFGRYAGLVGAYNAFLAYGQRNGTYTLKPAHQCKDLKEVKIELKKMKLPSNLKIVISGAGRVATGTLEILEETGIKKVSPASFLSQEFNSPCYTQLMPEDYNQRKDGKEFSFDHFVAHPEMYVSTFVPYTQVADIYISCHYWDAKAPSFFSEEDLKSNQWKIQLIADISCDINGPIPSTIRATTIVNPLYEFDRLQLKEVDSMSNSTITVMSVDNLPNELPRDASEGFGLDFIQNVFPALTGEDKNHILERATLTQNGRLNGKYTYLQDFVDGN